MVLAGIAVAQPPQPPPPKAREGRAEFALVSTTGNASTQSIGAAGQVIFTPPHEPAAGFNQTDTITSAALVLSF